MTFIKKNYLPGSLNLHRGGYLNDHNAYLLIKNADRAERRDNPVVYCKAIRCCLMALGFDPDWVNGRFRSMLESIYIYHDYDENWSYDEDDQ